MNRKRNGFFLEKFSSLNNCKIGDDVIQNTHFSRRLRKKGKSVEEKHEERQQLCAFYNEVIAYLIMFYVFH